MNTTYAQYPYPSSLASPPLPNLSSTNANIHRDNTSFLSPFAYSPSLQSPQEHCHSLTPPTTPWTPLPPPLPSKQHPKEPSSLPPSDPTSLTTFPAFRHLIPEIRELIWSLALPLPSLVPIYYNGRRGTFTSTAACIPALLSVCRESREVALRHYNLTFHASGSPPESARVYFNPSADVFYIPSVPSDQPLPGSYSTPAISSSSATHGSSHGEATPEYFGMSRHFPPNLVPFTSFLTTATLLSRSSLLAVRKLAIHDSVFLGTPGRWNNKALVEDHLRWFWWQVQDKFVGVEEVTFTGDEGTVLDDWSMEEEFGGEAWDDDDDDEGGVEVAGGVEQEREGDVEETLYNIALRTYWDLRKQEPSWVPPRWRVWGIKEPRRVGAGRLMECVGDEFGA